jgi:ubiquinol-cytochrome c reductase cytochrome c1 subunit
MAMKTLSRLLAAFLLLAAGGASASEAGLRLEPALVNRLDTESLQRGARNFVNYCLNCHGAQYMRYNRLSDLGLTEAQIKDNLMFATDKSGSTMTAPISRADGTAWFGAPPPDLSVESRIRGKDWIYSYFLGFYRDDDSTTGWNNLVFPGVAMPHVLWNLAGTQKLVETEYEDHEKAQAAAIAVKGLALVEPAKEGKWVVKTVAMDSPGALSTVEYKAFVADLVNYLDYMAEPVRNERINIGIVVMIYLGVLFVFAYALKRNYWKDVH